MENSTGTIVITIVRNEDGTSFQKSFTNVRNSEILLIGEMLKQEVLDDINEDIKKRKNSND
jgi:hypothetical protein